MQAVFKNQLLERSLGYESAGRVNYWSGLILGCMLATGCNVEDHKKGHTPPPAESPVASGNSETILEAKAQDDYIFEPPVLAPKSFSAVVPSVGKFTEREARYLNNCVYFLRETLEAAKRPDLVTGLDRLVFEPMTAEKREASLPGSTRVPFAMYDSGVVYINTTSPQFIDSARRFIPLVRTVAHEFCHHLAGDKTVAVIGPDHSSLFSMEAVAHGRTRTMCALMEKFVENMSNIPSEKRNEMIREIRRSELFARDWEVQYLVKRDVCQNLFNLLNEAGTEIRGRGLMTQETDQTIGGLMYLALQLRDISENGPEQLQGLGILTFDTKQFVSSFTGHGLEKISKLQSELEPMKELLLRLESVFVEIEIQANR